MKRVKTIEVTEVLCDKCGKSGVNTFMEQCVVCGCDVCKSCRYDITAPEGWVEATMCIDCFAGLTREHNVTQGMRGRSPLEAILEANK